MSARLLAVPVHTVALGLPELALLACFPVIVWGSDELRRSWLRRHSPRSGPPRLSRNGPRGVHSANNSRGGSSHRGPPPG